MAEYLYVPFPVDSAAATNISDLPIWADIGRAETNGLPVLTSNLSVWDNDAWDGGAVGHFIDKQGDWKNRLKRGARVLSVVQPTDVLYITGHGAGSNNPTVIGATLVKERPDQADLKAEKCLTATTLAKRLQKEGLTASVRNIAVIICNSGNDGNATAPTRDCFAQILARALGGLGYARVEVAGYTGTIAATGPATQIGTVSAGGQSYQLCHRSRVFDSHGNEV